MARGESSTKRQGEQVSLEKEPNVEETKQEVQQTRRERRLLRARYRDIKNAIAGGKDELAKPDELKNFGSCYDAIETLHLQVQKPREMRSDAEALFDMAATLEDTVRGANRKKGATPSDFVDAVMRKFQLKRRRKNAEEDSVNIDWGALGLEACVILREAPGLSTMTGPMDSAPKQKRTYTGRGKREKLGRMTQPDEIEGVSSSKDKQQTDANMEVMFAKLRSLRSVRLEALVLNRKSFAQTVENIFSLSFLVKDGRVEIKIEENKAHFVVPRNAPSGEDRERGAAPNTQFVFGFNYKDWELMKSVIPEGIELMPHRTSAQPSPLQENVTPVRITSRNRARETSTQDDVQEERATGKRRKLLN